MADMISVLHRVLRRTLGIAAIALIASAGLGARAQSPACPEMIRQALQNTGQNCVAVGRDQLCYGADHVEIALRADAGAGDARFQAPGDLVDMTIVDAIRPAALDAASGTWGVAYLRTRANLADVAAGQFVTLMLFGDVELQPASTSAPDGVQAYYFRTGIGGSDDASCQNAPANGILVQTPKGTGQVQIVVNEVRLSIGSTVFLQTTPTSLPRGPVATNVTRTPAPGTNRQGQHNTLRVQTFEGHVVVESGGRSELLIAGEELDVPLDDDFVADGPPEEPEAFDEDVLLGLDTFLEDASVDGLFDDREPVFDAEDFAAEDWSAWDTENWNWDDWDWDDDLGLEDGIGDDAGELSDDEAGDTSTEDAGAEEGGDPAEGDPGSGDPGEGEPPDGGG
jgi:hypothetical protein